MAFAGTAAGWIALGALLLAPWAFGCRTYFWSASLALVLLTAGLAWFAGHLEWQKRLPRIAAERSGRCGLPPSPGSVDWNVESAFALRLRVHGFSSPCRLFESLLPSTVDVTNSWPFAILTTGALAALVVTADLSAGNEMAPSFPSGHGHLRDSRSPSAGCF